MKQMISKYHEVAKSNGALVSYTVSLFHLYNPFYFGSVSLIFIYRSSHAMALRVPQQMCWPGHSSIWSRKSSQLALKSLSYLSMISSMATHIHLC